MTPAAEDVAAELVRGRASSTGVILDFDGTLAPVVARPEQVVVPDGVVEVLCTIAERYRLAAILTGRPSSEIAERLLVEGLEIVGLYGAEDLPPIDPEVVRAVTSALGRMPESWAGDVWVEDKGPFLAVHFRAAPDPHEAAARLGEVLMPIADAAGLELMAAKRVIELTPRGRAGKGPAVAELVRAHQLKGVLFAGDDVADLDAFVALDELASDGLLVTKIAVGGPETPDALLRAADLTVVGPAGLLAFLRRL